MKSPAKTRVAELVPPPGRFDDDEEFDRLAALQRGESITETDPLRLLVPRLSFDEIFTPDPDAKLIIPSLGLAPGPIHAIFAQYFVGKTINAYTFGLCVASGRPLFGIWPTKIGRWLHLDYEQGTRHTKKRIVRLIDGMGIDRESLRGQIEIAIYPKLTLTTEGAEALFTKLFTGFDIVTIDALRGLTPGVKENDTEIRDFIDMLGRASEASQAAVVVLHHAGKTDTQNKRPRKEMGRGASAIGDACQSVFVLTGEKGDPNVLVTHEKTRELTSTLEDFYVRIEDVLVSGDPHGGLKVVHVDAAQAKPTADQAVARMKSAIRNELQKRAGVFVGGSTSLGKVIGGRAEDFRKAFALMNADRELPRNRGPTTRNRSV